MDGTLTLLRDSHGKIVVLQDPPSSPKRGVLVLHGLPMGTIQDMRASIDAVMHEATGTEGLACLEAIILTTFPSFRIPDAVLRYAFLHTRRYASLVTAIHFVDLDVARRAVFWVACRALPAELRALVRLTSMRHLRDTVLGPANSRFLLNCVPPPPPSSLPVTPGGAKESPKRMPDAMILLDFYGSKQGSGRGPLASNRWKRKRFILSDSHLWYEDARDARLEGERLPLDACHLEVDGEDASAVTITATNHPLVSWKVCGVTPDCLNLLQAVLLEASTASEVATV